MQNSAQNQIQTMTSQIADMSIMSKEQTVFLDAPKKNIKGVEIKYGSSHPVTRKNLDMQNVNLNYHFKNLKHQN